MIGWMDEWILVLKIGSWLVGRMDDMDVGQMDEQSWKGEWTDGLTSKNYLRNGYIFASR